MKQLCIGIMVALIAAGAMAQGRELELDSNRVCVLTELIVSSGASHGNVQFEQKGLYVEYILKTQETILKVQSFLKEDKELVWIDTRAPEFNVFGLHVGLSEDSVVEVLGKPVRRLSKGDRIELEYYGKQYMLLAVIRNEHVERIFYNPFE